MAEVASPLSSSEQQQQPTMAPPEPLDTSTAAATMKREQHVEKLLSDALLRGSTLLQTCCPVCATPLVKDVSSSSPTFEKELTAPANEEEDEEATRLAESLKAAEEANALLMALSFDREARENGSGNKSAPTSPAASPNGASTAAPTSPTAERGASDAATAEPFEALPGVPHCVSCSCHVVTSRADLTALSEAGVIDYHTSGGGGGGNGKKRASSILVAMDDDDVQQIVERHLSRDNGDVEKVSSKGSAEVKKAHSESQAVAAAAVNDDEEEELGHMARAAAAAAGVDSFPTPTGSDDDDAKDDSPAPAPADNNEAPFDEAPHQQPQLQPPADAALAEVVASMKRSDKSAEEEAAKQEAKQAATAAAQPPAIETVKSWRSEEGIELDFDQFQADNNYMQEEEDEAQAVVSPVVKSDSDKENAASGRVLSTAFSSSSSTGPSGERYMAAPEPIDTAATPTKEMKEEDDEEEEQPTTSSPKTEEEYAARRELATKVLGAKMLQGYVLLETLCEECGMPNMQRSKDQKIMCVVCPALAKKARKKKAMEAKNAEVAQKKADAERLMEAEKLRKQSTTATAAGAKSTPPPPPPIQTQSSQGGAVLHQADAALQTANTLSSPRDRLLASAAQSEAQSKLAAQRAAEAIAISSRMQAEERARLRAEEAAEEERKRKIQEEAEAELRAKEQEAAARAAKVQAEEDAREAERQRKIEEAKVEEEADRVRRLEAERPLSPSFLALAASASQEAVEEEEEAKEAAEKEKAEAVAAATTPASAASTKASVDPPETHDPPSSTKAAAGASTRASRAFFPDDDDDDEEEEEELVELNSNRELTLAEEVAKAEKEARRLAVEAGVQPSDSNLSSSASSTQRQQEEDKGSSSKLTKENFLSVDTTEEDTNNRDVKSDVGPMSPTTVELRRLAEARRRAEETRKAEEARLVEVLSLGSRASGLGHEIDPGKILREAAEAARREKEEEARRKEEEEAKAEEEAKKKEEEEKRKVMEEKMAKEAKIVEELRLAEAATGASTCGGSVATLETAEKPASTASVAKSMQDEEDGQSKSASVAEKEAASVEAAASAASVAKSTQDEDDGQSKNASVFSKEAASVASAAAPVPSVASKEAASVASAAGAPVPFVPSGGGGFVGEYESMTEVSFASASKNITSAQSGILVSASEAMKKEAAADDDGGASIVSEMSRVTLEAIKLAQQNMECCQVPAVASNESELSYVARAAAEADEIARLEAEAAEKQRKAEEAIATAKAAMEEITQAKSKMIADVIAKAEAEAVAEVEAMGYAEGLEYHEPPPLPKSKSAIEHEQWETLLFEGRALMTRRLLQGWTMLPENCAGKNCGSTPLMSLNDGPKECVVCGGTGTGADGAYAVDVVPESSASRSAASAQQRSVSSPQQPPQEAAAVASNPRHFSIQATRSRDEGGAMSPLSIATGLGGDTMTTQVSPRSIHSIQEEVGSGSRSVHSQSLECRSVQEEAAAGELVVLSIKSDRSVGRSGQSASSSQQDLSAAAGSSFEKVGSSRSSVHSQSALEHPIAKDLSTATTGSVAQVGSRSVSSSHLDAKAQPSVSSKPQLSIRTSESVTTPVVSMTEEDFEAKRGEVSKEIGRRMLVGWSLLDAPCPHCVMPLMSETPGGPEVCVLCGPIAKVADAPPAADDMEAQLAEEQAKLNEEKAKLEEAKTWLAEVEKSRNAASPTQGGDNNAKLKQLTISTESNVNDDISHLSMGTPSQPMLVRSSPTAMSLPKIDDATSTRTSESESKGKSEDFSHVSAGSSKRTVPKDPSAELRSPPRNKDTRARRNLDEGDDASTDKMLQDGWSFCTDSLPCDKCFGPHMIPPGSNDGPGVCVNPECSKGSLKTSKGSKKSRRPAPTPDRARVPMGKRKTTGRRVPPSPDASHRRPSRDPRRTSQDPPAEASTAEKKLPPRPRMRSASPRPGGNGFAPSPRARALPSPRSRRVRSQSPAGRFKPPRPDDGTASSTVTPRSRKSMERRNDRPSLSGRDVPNMVGSSSHEEDTVFSDEMSMAQSVATDTLGAILSRIEDAKAELEHGSEEDVEHQMEMAKLIEKLASAAVAVKQLEELG